jgi:hypothetical protein
VGNLSQSDQQISKGHQHRLEIQDLQDLDLHNLGLEIQMCHEYLDQEHQDLLLVLYVYHLLNL